MCCHAPNLGAPSYGRPTDPSSFHGELLPWNAVSGYYTWNKPRQISVEYLEPFLTEAGSGEPLTSILVRLDCYIESSRDPGVAPLARV